MSWPRPACSTATAAPSTGRTCRDSAEAFPEIKITGSLFEIDRDRFSSAGGTSALDMMLALIASQHGAELAANVAEIGPAFADPPSQRASAHVAAGAHRRPPSQARRHHRGDGGQSRGAVVAKPAGQAQAGLSTRQLERLFRRYLDRSPKRYYLELRLKKARSLLLQTDMSVINVALACGFSSPSHFSKCYRAFYGRTPYRERGIPALETGAAA